MRDIGAVVWVLIVIVGVITSIVQNVRKNSPRAQAPPPAQGGRPRPPAAPPQQVQPPAPSRVVTFGASGLQTQYSTQMQPAVPPIAPPAPATVVVPRRAVVAAQPRLPSRAAPITSYDLLLPHERPRRRRPGFARLFGSRASLARAVIAAEVLGKPHALRDEYSWRCQ